MSGRSALICGSRRGYLLTDGAAVAQVADLLDASPKKPARRLHDRGVDIINRRPHLARADASGSGVLLVLTVLNGVQQSVLVERRGATRRMTCVPLRFDDELFRIGTVFSGSLVRDPPVLILEDVLRLGAGVVEGAGAEERAGMLHSIVHDRFVADLVLQPFAVQCARYMAPHASACRDVWKTFPYPVRSVTFCPLAPGYPDLFSLLQGGGGDTAAAASAKKTVPPMDGRVSVVPGDAPDVYRVQGGGTLVVRTLHDSHVIAALARKGGHAPFQVRAEFDKHIGRWIFLRD